MLSIQSLNVCSCLSAIPNYVSLRNIIVFHLLLVYLVELIRLTSEQKQNANGYLEKDLFFDQFYLIASATRGSRDIKILLRLSAAVWKSLI